MDDCVYSKYELMEQKTTTSASKVKFVESIFQYMVTQAIWLLITHCSVSLNKKNFNISHRFVFHIAKLLQPSHAEYYNELINLSGKDLNEKFLKIRNTSFEEKSKEIFDSDFTEIYKILKTICENYWYLPILKQYVIGLDLNKIYFEVDVFLHNIHILQRN